MISALLSEEEADISNAQTNEVTLIVLDSMSATHANGDRAEVRARAYCRCSCCRSGGVSAPPGPKVASVDQYANGCPCRAGLTDYHEDDR